MAPLRVAVVHNRYQQAGGEDGVFETECALLEQAGVHVVRYEADNAAVRDTNRVRLALNTVWNRSAYRTLSALFERERVSVVHVHNTLPLISPSVYAAARRAGAAVVQTLHNYRLLCPAATLYRDSAPCELCVGRTIPWPSVAHACYRGDRAATATIATMLALHKVVGTYKTRVDRYIALTHFAKRTFVAGGLPEERIVVKPNSVSPPTVHGPARGGPALFVGRLSEEKGVLVLLDAWRAHQQLPQLRVVGDGPLRHEAERRAHDTSSVHVVGRVPSAEMPMQYAQSSMLVFPSTWYEGFPLTIVEAMSSGLPVIASRLGSIAEIVEDGKTGLLFDANDPHDLARKVLWLAERPDAITSMGRAARETYEARYAPRRNLEALLSIYDEAHAVASASEMRR